MYKSRDDFGAIAHHHITTTHHTPRRTDDQRTVICGHGQHHHLQRMDAATTKPHFHMIIQHMDIIITQFGSSYLESSMRGDAMKTGAKTSGVESQNLSGNTLLTLQ